MSTIRPPATIGIIGGGQLGKMLSQAAKRLGYRTIILDPAAACPAAGVCDEHLVARFDDPIALAAMGSAADVITYEFENVASAPLLQLAKETAVYPDPRILHTLCHRTREKTALRKLGVKTADFIPIDDPSQLAGAVDQLGLPAILKVSEGGYDGKGQQLLSCKSDLASVSLAAHHTLEAYISFSKEISVICARNIEGEISSFPVTENIHRNHILCMSIAPARLPEETAQRAVEIAEQVVEGLAGVGAFGIEMFLQPDGEILVNEIAPRVHNSGHYTIEACHLSQFEQHIRAICGLPLGDNRLRRPAVMVNILGEGKRPAARLAGIPDLMRIPEVNLHLYGKEEVRPGRKMGHLTALADSLPLALERAGAAHRLLRWEDD